MKKLFKDFKDHQIKETRAIMGGYEQFGGGTSHIKLTFGSTGLSTYSDPVYNDGTIAD
jgi:hypothetical protein